MVSLVSSSWFLDWVDCMPQYGQHDESNPPIITPQFVLHPQASAFPASDFSLTQTPARWLTLTPILPLRHYHEFYYQSPVTYFNPPPYQHYAFRHQFAPFSPPMFVRYSPQIWQPLITIPLAMPSYIIGNTHLNPAGIDHYIEQNHLDCKEERPETTWGGSTQPQVEQQLDPNLHEHSDVEVPTITEDFEDFDDETQQSDIFQYLVNKNTYLTDKLFKFRKDAKLPSRNLTTIVFQPVARAIAGENGRAIANPLSRALIQKGVDTDIHYNPEAVAVAGPGGIAHAQSDLEISYLDELED